MAATIKDIARLAKVSHTTVSRALNDSPLIREETRKRIRELADRINYIPNYSAKSLVLEKSFNIGLFAPKHIESMPTSFLYEVMEGISSGIGDSYNLILRKLNDGSEIKSIISKRNFDGIIFLSIDTSDIRLIYKLAELETPVVVLNRNLKNEGIHCVYVDEYHGALEAVEHLINSGHRDIAIIEGPETFISTEQRFLAYRDALARKNIRLMEDYIVQGGFNPEGGFEVMKKYLHLKNRPTAVFVSNDLMAAGALKACSQFGYRVPDDISVMGFDDMDFSKYLIPSLTTVRKPRRLMGKEGAVMLLNLMSNKNIETGSKQIKTELVLRESCSGI